MIKSAVQGGYLKRLKGAGTAQKTCGLLMNLKNKTKKKLFDQQQNEHNELYKMLLIG